MPKLLANRWNVRPAEAYPWPLTGEYGFHFSVHDFAELPFCLDLRASGDREEEPVLPARVFSLRRFRMGHL